MSAENPDAAEEDDDIQYFVRIEQTDLDGTKSVERSLTDMNGIGRRAARLIAAEADVARTERFGALEQEQIDEIVDLVEGFADEVPDWLANHRNDFFGGETTHEIGHLVYLLVVERTEGCGAVDASFVCDNPRCTMSDTVEFC